MIKYIINSTVGINGIDRISLKKVIETFSIPDEIEIKESKNKIELAIDLRYGKRFGKDEFIIYYTLDCFVENLKKPETKFLVFNLKKLYLNEKESIKIGEELKVVLSKVKKYLRKNKKSLDFKYIENEDEYEVEYLFDDGRIDLFFDKIGYKKILKAIEISLPPEDILDNNKTEEEIKDIMELKEKIEELFFINKN